MAAKEHVTALKKKLELGMWLGPGLAPHHGKNGGRKEERKEGGGRKKREGRQTEKESEKARERPLWHPQGISVNKERSDT